MTPKGIIPAPNINVTPLIDVLLVLLIIFMVAAPLKPHRFLATLPSMRDPDSHLPPDPLTLVVSIQPDRTLKLNEVTNMGTVYDLSPLALKLKSSSWPRDLSGAPEAPATLTSSRKLSSVSAYSSGRR